MKNTFGNNVSVTLFGESHGAAIGAVIDGLAPGIKIDYAFIEKRMEQRKGSPHLSTPRRESDEVKIVSGVFDGYSTGAPICLLIENNNVSSKDYASIKNSPRPSHADYAAYVRYGEWRDYRGGGHFSGRITAALVAAGAIIAAALRERGVLIGTHIRELHGIAERSFESYRDDILLLDGKLFPTLDDGKAELMKKEILKARGEGDSVGGILESAIIGLEAGVGEPWFNTLEGHLAHAIFSIPGVKGIEFGAGFAFADMKGSEANDELTVTDGKICTLTNNNGGINGGLSNGMPIVFRTAVKPTPSIFKEQRTVSLERTEPALLKIEGRHDPAIIHRARAVVDAVAAIAVADMLAARYGADCLAPRRDI